VIHTRGFAAFNFFILILSLGTWGQTIIDNPSVPPSKNSGRVVPLTEVLRIIDQGQNEYYFEYPSRLHLASDGSIFVLDVGQLLHFDQTGKFVRDYFKKGQGPGELNFVSDFWLTANYLIVHNHNPSKVVWFDFSGNLVKDVGLRAQDGSTEFLLFDGEAYYFKRLSFREKNGMQGIIENPQVIVSWREGNDRLAELGNFPIRAYFKRGKEGGAGFIPLNKLIWVSAPETLYVSHTPEYLVKAVDLKTGKIVRLIRRSYKRVKPPPDLAGGIRGGAMIDGKELVAPAPDYADDIVNLFLHEDYLWVATSVQDKDKGTLIDVFDSAGRYVDCFYMKLPIAPYSHLQRPSPHIVSGDFLYAIGKNPDETYSIIKYRMGL
jgi:hypothetical protein